MSAGPLSADARLGPFLDAAATASDHAARWAASKKITPDERSTSGVWADHLEASSGIAGDVEWRVTTTPAGGYETGRGRQYRQAGGFDVFVGIDVGVSGRDPVRKGLLVQAKRLDELQSSSKERRRLRKQCEEMDAITRAGGWVVIFGPNQARLIRANRVVQLLPASRGGRAEVDQVWKAAVPIRRVLMEALDCLAGASGLPTFGDVQGRLDAPYEVKFIVTATARS